MSTDARVAPPTTSRNDFEAPKPPQNPAEVPAYLDALKKQRAENEAARVAKRATAKAELAASGAAYRHPGEPKQEAPTVIPFRAAPDFITILKSLDKPLAKTIVRAANGELDTRTNAKAYEYSGEEKPVRDIDSLGAVLNEVSTHAHQCVVRGKIIDTADKARMRRLIHDREEKGAEVKATLEEVLHYWALLDFDSIEAPPGFDPLANPTDTVALVKTLLPTAFKDATVWYQLTSGAGVKPGIRIRLGFWLNRALSNEDLKRWLAKCPIDKSLFSPNQPHYTAAPKIAPGATDPLAGRPRSGIIRGAVDTVAVPEFPSPEVSVAEFSAPETDMPKSIDECLAAIGDHPGGLGCHPALKRAVSAYFRKHGAGASTKVLIAALTQTVRAAKWDDKEHSKQYLQNEIDGLPRLIESVQGLQRETEKPLGIEPYHMPQGEAPPTADEMPKFVAIREVLNEEVTPVEEIVPGLIEKHMMTLLAGAGGAYKSQIGIQWGLCIDSGKPIFSRAVVRAKFICVSYEDSRGEVARRMQAVARRLNLPEDITGQYLNMHARHMPLAVVKESGDSEPTPFYHHLRQELRSIDGHKFVVLDSSYDVLQFCGAAKINEASVKAAIAQIDRLCVESDSTILMLWHPSQAGQERGDASGWSVAWHNRPRARLSMTQDKDHKSRVVLKVEKRNHGPAGESIALHYVDGALLAHDETATVEQEAILNDAVVRVVTTAAEMNMPIQRQRRAERSHIDEIEKASGRRLKDKEFKDLLVRAAMRGRLSYVRGSKYAAAGYYPTDRATELARGAKAETRQKPSKNLAKT
jgi:AAA domain